MKTISRVLVILLFVSSSLTQAQIIPVSSTSVISVSGTATVPLIYGGQSDTYSLINSAANFSSFTGSVGGDAFAEITILPPFALFLGTTLHAASSATQTTSIGADTISISSAVSAVAWMYSQVGSRSSYARSLTEITFSIDQLSVFSLSGSGSHFQSGSPYTTSTYVASLTSSDGAQLFQATDNRQFFNSSGYSFDLIPPMTGLLQAGTYTLRTDINANALFDPLGESGGGNISLMLRVTNVPDTADVATLLLISGLGIVLCRRIVLTLVR